MNKFFAKKFCTNNSSISGNSLLKSKKLSFAGKLVYFLSGAGLTFIFTYTNFMNQVKKNDAILKSDIEEIRKIVEKQNLEEKSLKDSKNAQHNTSETKSESSH